MGIESAARTWAHRHGLQRSRLVVAAYRALSRLRYRGAWDDELSFRGHQFVIGKDLSLFPAVRNGGFEAEELDVLLPLVPSDAVIWDVGANIGIYTVLLAAAARDGHVLAFEPVPASHQRLLGNVARSGLSNVTVHQIALSSRRGTAWMAVHRDAHGCDQIDEAETGAEGVEVPTTTGDEVLARSGRGDPDVVKVDIEGHEPEFLQGTWQMVARRRPLLMLEVNPASWASVTKRVQWQSTLDQLFEIYGSGEWFGVGGRTTVTHVEADGLEERAFTLLFVGNHH